jgi:hypothetical protein
MLYLTIILLFVFFAGVAMTVGEGLWSNTVSLLCIMLAGSFAIFGGIPLGLFIVEQAGASDEQAWYFVFGGVWGVFFVSLTIMRILVEMASRTRVRFVPPLEKAAGPLMGLFVAVMLTSFTAYTLARIPINAGAWKYSDAADWQKTTFTYACAPFHTVVKRLAEAESVKSNLFPQAQ